LQDGTEIAVKRLSENSAQGFNELKNELVLANRLKHRNLVQLLGVCFQEKLLVYEYMPKGSLHSILFGNPPN
jgi:serine/threonine protein kinase